nr:hypothetical protein [Tanacetum cinerariifolium]
KADQPYYQEYLEKVAKHQRYLAGEQGSDPESTAPKPTKATKKSKPSAPKADLRPPVIKPASSQQPEPKPAPAKLGLVSKRRKPISSLRSVDKSVAEGIPEKEPRVDDEEADVQRALEESLKSIYDAPRGSLPPVVIREPESGKYQPLLEVQGKGKEKVTDEHVARDLLTLQTPKKKSPADKFIFQRCTSTPTGSSGHNESSSLYAELWLMDSEAGPNPSDAASSQPLPSSVIHDGPNLEHMDLEENLKLTVEEKVILEEPVSSTWTLSSLQHLTKDLSFGYLFFNDKPSEADNKKITVETKGESMVSVTIQQDTSSIPPMKTPVIDLTSRPESRASGSPGAFRSSQVLPPPPPPPSTNQESQSHGSIALSSSKTAASAEYKAWTMTDTRFRLSVSLTPKDLQMDNDMALNAQAQSFNDEDIGNAYIPKVNLQQDWWQPLEDDIPATPKHAGSILSSDVPMKATYYLDVGLEKMVPDQMWIGEECKHTSEGDHRAVRTHMRILSVVRIEVFSMYGYDYIKKIVLRRADLNEHIIAKRDFKYLYPSDFEDMYLLNLQEHPSDTQVFTLKMEILLEPTSNKLLIDDLTARMAVRVLLAMSPSLSASIAKADEEEEDKGPTLEDEDPATRDEDLAAGDEGHALVIKKVVGEPLGLGYEALRRQEIALGEVWMPSVFEVCRSSGSVPVSERPERVLALRQPTLTTWIDPENGRTYIDVPAYPSPVPPIQTPLSLEWSSGLLLVSPAPSIIPSPISSPIIPLTVEIHGGLIRDHTVRLGELSPALFKRYDMDIGELFTRSGTVRDEIFSQICHFKSLEHEQERVAVTFGVIWRPILSMELWAGQMDVQRTELWHAFSDTHMEN